MPRSVLAATFVALALVATAQAGLFSPLEDELGGAASFPVTGGFGADCPGELRVGVAAVDVTPGVKRPDASYELWMEPWDDENGNGVYDGPDPVEGTFESEPFNDENLNGKWDGPFMAGYGHEKEGNEYYVAEGAHDPVWARAIALTCADRTIGLVSVDTVGLFRGFTLDVRDAAPVEYDYVTVASTHTHDSIDTMGLWGPSLLIDGKDPRTIAHYKAGVLDALASALDAREEVASVQVGMGLTRDLIPFAGTVQTDLRDPFVIDDRVLALRFIDADGATIATMINWSPHPETMAGTRSEISSDYAHYLRLAVESEGATVNGERAEPVGGTAVFFVGAVGGMMTTLGANPLMEDGTPAPPYSYEKIARIGEVAAFVALDALRESPVLPADGFRFQAAETNVPSDNPFLMALNTIGVLDHEIFLGPVQVDPIGPLGFVPPVPVLRAEVNVVTLVSDGNDLVQAFTFPGEMLPEVVLGNPLLHDAEATLETCYAYNAEKHAFNQGREGKIDPATLQRTPGFERKLAARPAYEKEPAIVHRSTAPYVMMFGLANDELGYIVPANDFVEAAMFPEVYTDGVDRCGDSDHYEETNSGGSLLAPAITDAIMRLLDPTWGGTAEPMQSAGFVGGAGATLDPLEARGVWIDTSRSGGYESQEDARVLFAPPAGLPGCWGFLDGSGYDMGREPDDETRGFWIDLDGDCAPGVGDAMVFADFWGLSEGQPHYRP